MKDNDYSWTTLIDNLMEAMILLDPPPIFTITDASSSLSLPNVMKAYDLLLKTSNQFNCFDNDDNLNNNEIIDCQNNENGDNDKLIITAATTTPLSFVDKISNIADLYRAIILSSSLLLEMWEDDNDDDDDDDNYNNNMKKQVCQTIQQSILLLQRLCYIIYLATIMIKKIPKDDKNKLQQQQKIMKEIILSMKEQSQIQQNQPVYDWHDMILPKSQFPLLQECFERKELMDVETGIVFGYDDRIISLVVDDYNFNEIDNDYLYDNNNNNHDNSNWTHHNDDDVLQNDTKVLEHESKNVLVTSHDSDKETKHGYFDEFDNNVINSHSLLTLNKKDIEKEEIMLLDIALPSSTNRNNCSNHTTKYSRKRNYLQGPGGGHQTSDRYNRRNEHMILNGSSLPDSFVGKNVLKYIEIPFTTNKETFPVTKEGYLVLSNTTNDAPSNKNSRCYARLFNNGVLFLSLCDESKLDNDILVYRLAKETSKCTTSVHSNTFYFKIDNIFSLYYSMNMNDTEHMYSKQATSITFAIDKNLGGNFLSNGWEWTSSFDDCIDLTRVDHSLCERMSTLFKELGS